MDINYVREKYEPIDGKWYITKELGKGAFGTVFEVERRDYTNHKCALKVIGVPASSSELDGFREENYDLDDKSITSYFRGFVDEFIKEFKFMSKLRGESNIVSIEDYDVKEHEGEIGWDILIRMELLTPMNKYFMQNAPTRKDIIKLGMDICGALEICQHYNIVHRDIKPSNIFVSESGNFKLGDFGVARTLEKTSSGLSQKGTFTYMAPEAYKGEECNSSIDIYSLGIVLYKLLNNNFEPFRTERTHSDEEKAFTTRMKGDVPLPPPANADKKLADIVLKACSYNPATRYTSAAELKKDLERALEGEADTVVKNVIAEPVVAQAEQTVGVFDVVPESKPESTFDGERTQSFFDIKPETEKQEPVKEEKPTELEPAEPKKKSKVGLVIGIVAGVIAIIVAVCVFLFWNKGNGTTENALQVTYEEKVRYDENGNIVAEFDENGNLVRDIQYDADGNITQRYTYQYDANGDVVRCVFSEHDEDGNIVKATIFDENDNISSIEEYDTNGNCIFETEYDANGDVVRRVFYEHDEDGNIVKATTHGENDSVSSIEEFDANGDVVRGVFYERDEDGNLIGVQQYDKIENRSRAEIYSEGVLSAVFEINENGIRTETWYNSDGTLGYEDVYDNKGNVVSQIYYNADGSINIYSDEKYEGGRRVGTTWYNDDGSLSHGWEYDTNGNAVREIHYNSYGDVSEYIVYTYDAAGNITSKTWYSGDGTMLFTE